MTLLLLALAAPLTVYALTRAVMRFNARTWDKLERRDEPLDLSGRRW